MVANKLYEKYQGMYWMVANKLYQKYQDMYCMVANKLYKKYQGMYCMVTNKLYEKYQGVYWMVANKLYEKYQGMFHPMYCVSPSGQQELGLWQPVPSIMFHPSILCMVADTDNCDEYSTSVVYGHPSWHGKIPC